MMNVHKPSYGGRETVAGKMIQFLTKITYIPRNIRKYIVGKTQH